MGKMKEEFERQMEILAKGIRADPEELKEEYFTSGLSLQDFIKKKIKK